MAKATAMSPIRIEKSVAIEEYSNDDSSCEDYEAMLTSPDSSSCRSSADADKNLDLEDDFRKEALRNLKFDDIIEKIEILRIAQTEEDENETSKSTEKVDNFKYSADELNNVRENESNSNYENNKCKNGPLTDDATSDGSDANGNSEVGEKEEKEVDEEEDVEDEEEEEEEEEIEENSDSEDGELLERGPTGPPHFHSPNRDEQLLEYDDIPQPLIKKIHEIYHSQLNPCLDQLTTDSNRNFNNAYNNGYENQFYSNIELNNGCLNETGGKTVDGTVCNDQSSPSPPSILVDGVDDSSTVKYFGWLQQGKCQPAQVIPEAGNSVSSPPAKTWPDSPMSNYVMPSSSTSRSSSRTQSPGYAASLESPMMYVTSPLGSPQVVPTYRAPPEQSSPSSSNLSYGDTSSSPSNYNVPLNHYTEDQLSDNLRTGFNSWNDSSATIVNTTDSVEFNCLDKEEKVNEINWRNFQKSDETCESVSNFNLNDFIYSHVENDSCQIRQQCQVRQNSSLDCTVEFSGFDGNQILNYSPRQQGLAGCSYGGAQLIENNEGNAYNPYATFSNVLQQDVLRNSVQYRNENTLNRTDNLSHGVPVMQDKSYIGGFPNAVGIVDQQRRNDYGEVTEQVFGNFQVPEMRMSSPKPSRSRRNSLRKIVPWPSLNMPSTKASDRLMEGLPKKEIRDAMTYLLTKSPEELNEVDEDGDTTLMRLVGNPEELKKKRVYLAPLVLRLRDTKDALTKQNTHDEDALYLAAMNCPEMPYVTGFLAAEMWEKEIDISQTLYHKRGDTLIHAVASRGDTHGDVLAELLSLRSSQGHPVFNLSTRNYDGKTALHLAILSHASGMKSIGVVRLLLENGADPRLKENKGGDTALHMAVLSRDPTLVKVLLGKTGSDVMNITNGTKNTPLHVAAGLNDTCWERQEKMCRLLVEAGAQINIQNDCGKTPLALVSVDRKEAIRRIFYRRS